MKKHYTVVKILEWFFTFPFFHVQAVIGQVGEKFVDFLNIIWYIWFQENKQLQDMNEDLNAQLLTRCINEGKTLVNDTKAKSLATELEHLTKEEVAYLYCLLFYRNSNTKLIFLSFLYMYLFMIVFIAHNILKFMTACKCSFKNFWGCWKCMEFLNLICFSFFFFSAYGKTSRSWVCEH